jgi:hypothetical protein
MDPPFRCPRCNTKLPGDGALGELCPRCLLALVIEVPSDASDEAAGRNPGRPSLLTALPSSQSRPSLMPASRLTIGRSS